MNRTDFWRRVERLVKHRGFNVTPIEARDSHTVQFTFHCPCGRDEREQFTFDTGTTIRKAASEICADLNRHMREGGFLESLPEGA